MRETFDGERSVIEERELPVVGEEAGGGKIYSSTPLGQLIAGAGGKRERARHQELKVVEEGRKRRREEGGSPKSAVFLALSGNIAVRRLYTVCTVVSVLWR